jgi:tetratricopeptide (TPR) repeat protein
VTHPLMRVPELIEGLDVRTLPLSALEGFVLSRIDGRAPVREILAVTGLPPDQVMEMLERLCTLGAARWKGEGSPSSSGVSAKPVTSAHAPAAAVPTGAPSASPPSARRKSSGSHPPVRRPAMSEAGVSQPPPDMRRTGSGTHPAVPSPAAPPTSRTFSRPAEATANSASSPVQAPVRAARPSLTNLEAIPLRYDPRELEEECDLPRERRKQVLDLFYRLKDLDYYEALNIPYDADKKQVRSAYFACSKAFHPDTMFRKDLGSFKAKMEAVFKHLTEGYETLGKKKARDEYDAYLRSTKATQMAERALAMAAHEAAEAARALEVELPPPPPLPAGFPSAPPQAEPSPPRETSEQARRLAQEVVARRLRGVISSPLPSRAPETRESPASLPEPPTRDPQAALQGLGRALKGASELTGRGGNRTAVHVEQSRQALARGDLNEATQQLRRAISLAPERLDLQAEYETLSRQLAEKLAEEYVVQAQFEAKQGKWAAAAIAWARVCEGRPQNADAHRQTALALLKVGGDLRSAQKYAQQASFLAPADVEARVLLAQIYLTLGLKLNARRELDSALKLDPGNEMVKNLLSGLKG